MALFGELLYLLLAAVHQFPLLHSTASHPPPPLLKCLALLCWLLWGLRGLLWLSQRSRVIGRDSL